MISHIFYISKHLITLLTIKLPIQLLGLITVAIGLLFRLSDKRIAMLCGDQRLPKIFTFWDVGDKIDRKYGLNGDLPYQSVELFGSPVYKLSHLSNAIYVLEEDGVEIINKWTLFKLRYKWLALRNPANWFQYNVLGVKSSTFTDITYMSLQPDILTEEVGDWSSSGYRYTKMETIDGEDIREYYLIWKYPEWLTKRLTDKKKCVRIRIGYKLGEDPLNTDRDTIQWVCAIQPWKTYLGK